MLVRVIFTAILLGSTLYVQFQGDSASGSLLVLYAIIAFIFLLSVCYGILFNRVERKALFTTVQFGIDAFIVTLIIFITGGFYSFFTFLYLVVIIYASMILYLRGGLLVAGMSSGLYILLILLEYAGVLPGLGDAGEIAPYSLQWPSMLYRILITCAACFAVALLSGLLTEQNRKSQNELRAMETHLKRVDKMAYMGEMAAGLAHEIKNPLASLVGCIQLLKEDLCYAPDQERLMEIILRETDRLSTLVNDFLFFARPPAGKPETIHIKSAVSEIMELFEKDMIHAARVKLTGQLPTEAKIIMDRTHLSQVLWNLLLNAAESLNGEGQIEVKAIPSKNDGVIIEVADNGCGMEPDLVQSIFDPFFTTKSKGTGLGLSIVHRILESYGSRLDVRSKPGIGTTFSFPLQQPAQS
jgi:two-component system sensor histidine kinase PilS (NtrC family)